MVKGQQGPEMTNELLAMIDPRLLNPPLLQEHIVPTQMPSQLVPLGTLAEMPASIPPIPPHSPTRMPPQLPAQIPAQPPANLNDQNAPKTEFQCPKCGKKVQSQYSLTRHDKTIHQGKETKICDYPNCPRKGKPFNLDSLYRRHMKSIHGVEIEPKRKRGPNKTAGTSEADNNDQALDDDEDEDEYAEVGEQDY
jgi:uncharacterized C2H2 Zn-finger protein